MSRFCELIALWSAHLSRPRQRTLPAAAAMNLSLKPSHFICQFKKTFFKKNLAVNFRLSCVFFPSRFIFNGFGFSRERQLIDSITQSQKQREIYSKTKTPANAEKIIHSCGVILLFLRLGTFFSSAVHVSRTASSSKGRIVLKEVILAAWDLHLQWLYHRVHTGVMKKKSWVQVLGGCWGSFSFICVFWNSSLEEVQ